MKLLRQKRLLVIAALILPALAIAKPWWMRGIESNESDFLPPDAAFRVGARTDGNVIRVRWIIAEGYYLYRLKMQVEAESPDLMVSAPAFPKGIRKTDPFLGAQEIFTQQVEAAVPFTRFDAGAHPIQIKVTYQGCAEAGLCYPPISKVIFPEVSPPPVPAQPTHRWEGTAIIGGGLAFLWAGFVLRKGRRLDMPA